MIITCGYCGREIEVPAGTLPGQHVRCPYCNEKSKLDAPSRIELPDGFERKRRSRAKIDAMRGRSVPEPDVPDLPQRPKLAIRRDGVLREQVREGARDAVSAVDARVRRMERRRRMQRIRKSLTSLVSFLVVGVVAWIVYGVFLADKVTVPTDGTGSFVTNDVERALSRMPREAVSPDVRVSARAHSPEEERQTAELRARYGARVRAFRGAGLSTWRLMPDAVRPGKADGTVHVLVPRTSSHQELFEIVTAGGVVTVRRMRAEDDGVAIPRHQFEKTLSDCGGLFLADGKAYAFRPKHARVKWSVPDAGKAFDPEKAFFGALADFLVPLAVDGSGLSYEVRLSFGDRGKPLVMAEVRSGETVAYEAFGRAIDSRVRELWLDRRPDPPKISRFKPTVVFYEGAYVSRAIRGLTKVPRKFSHGDDRGYYEWLHLKEEAERQEREAANSEREAARLLAEWRAKAKGGPDPQLVEAVVRSADVTIVVKEREGMSKRSSASR